MQELVREDWRHGVKNQGGALAIFSVGDTAALLGKHRDIVKALKAGQGVRNAVKITGKGMSTVQRVKSGARFLIVS